MARDQVEVMRQLGFERFFVAGHDRGGRVRLPPGARSPRRASSSSPCSTSCPPLEAFRARRHGASALGYWHWFFLAQPYRPSRAADRRRPAMFYFAAASPAAAEPPGYLRRRRRSPSTGAASATRRPSTPSARTTAPPPTIDFAHDEADRGRRRIACPLLALWGAERQLERLVRRARHLARLGRRRRGRAVDCGHYLAEEAPDETYRALRAFFAG